MLTVYLTFVLQVAQQLYVCMCAHVKVEKGVLIVQVLAVLFLLNVTGCVVCGVLCQYLLFNI